MNLLGKLLMTLSMVAYAVIPPIVDLTTDTHVFHEGWLPHARMHTVWLLGVTSGVGVLAMYLLWVPGPNGKFRLNMSALLSAIVYGAFFLSALTISQYGGALSDVVGGVEKGPFGFDANVFTFSVASLVLVLGWGLASRNQG